MKEQDVKGKRNRWNRKHKIACSMHVNNGNTMDIIDLVVLIKKINSSWASEWVICLNKAVGIIIIHNPNFIP